MHYTKAELLRKKRNWLAVMFVLALMGVFSYVEYQTASKSLGRFNEMVLK